MTTEECIKSIQSGISLIAKSQSLALAHYHETFTRGELSAFARIGIINSQTFNDLWKDIDLTIKQFIEEKI